MKINPMVMPIRMWQASIDFWQDVAIAQLQMNRCALTMMGLWPSERIKELGSPKAKPAANRSEAVPAKAKPVTTGLVKAEPATVKPKSAEVAKAEPVKVEAGKAVPAAKTATPKPARRKAATTRGQATPKPASRRKAAASPAKVADHSPLSDTRH